MKLFLAASLLLVLVSGLSARSLSNAALTFEKASNSVGDIWKNCGSSSDVAKLNNVVISPDPPERGKPIKVTANVTTSSTITGGSIHIEIKWGFIKALDTSVQVCDVVEQANLKCPLAAGTYTATQSESLPAETPPGHYTGSAVGTGADGKQIFCIDLDFRM